MSELVKVDFHGDSVWARQDAPEDEPIVAVKPIVVDNLKIDWEAQRQRIQRDEILRSSACIIQVPTPGGPQETTGLPLSLLPGFLFGISAERIADPDKRARVLAYQRECHKVLYDHFFGRHESVDPTVDRTLYEINTKLRLVENATKLAGKAAARAIWADLGLPPLVEGAATAAPRTGALQGLDFVKQFLAERTAEAPGGRVQARELSVAYSRWAADAKAPEMSERSLAMCLDALGIAKTRGHVVHYLGLRILHLSEFAADLDRQ